MQFQKLVLVSALALSSLCSFANDRIGERADYELDRNRNRTTSLIQAGSLKTTILGYNEAGENSEATYTTEIAYKLDILMAGKQEGVEKPMIAESFFNDEMIHRLRAEKEIQTDNYKAKHLGYQTVKNKDGVVYENCDIIYFYDINMGLSSELNHILFALLGQHDGRFLDNVSAKLARKAGLPVLSLAKIDIAGRHSGIRFKAGFDLKSQSHH